MHILKTLLIFTQSRVVLKGGVVLRNDQQLRQRHSHLEHQANDNDHKDARHDVSMIGDDEFVGKVRR